MTANPPHLIELKVSDIHQLFNSMDPSPFHERDLDRDAEQFIVSWAQECPKRSLIRIVVHLAKRPDGMAQAEELIATSFQHYFRYRADMTLREFKQLLREGRISLLIGLLFLVSCQILASFLAADQEHWQGIVREGLTIAGWVAMWKPLEIGLYRWWPLLHFKRLLEKLGRSAVEVRVGD
ncbi:MAG: hypothetical protein JNK37_07845 [Verrucomicrobiales bacterium]|nr:hypothetical protein [Verrucomicrobiales bacterium]